MHEQLRFLRADCSRLINGRWWRWASIPFSRSLLVVAFYRLDRGLFLTFGRLWAAARIVLSPLTCLIRPWVNAEIHYRADIGPGLLVLHPSLGTVVSAFAVAGRNLILTGGNCVGSRPQAVFPGAVTLGDDVELGVNAVVLGPATVGSGAFVAAGAVVVEDVAPGMTVAGVPARVIESTSR